MGIEITADQIKRHRVVNPQYFFLWVHNETVKMVTCGKYFMVVELVGAMPGEAVLPIQMPQINTALDLTVIPFASMVMSGQVNMTMHSTLIDARYLKFRDHIENANTVDQSFGFIYYDAEMITAIGSAAPSGELVLPKIIDTRKPIVANDPNDANWFALFVARDENWSNGLKPAIIPGFAL